MMIKSSEKISDIQFKNIFLFITWLPLASPGFSIGCFCDCFGEAGVFEQIFYVDMDMSDDRGNHGRRRDDVERRRIY